MSLISALSAAKKKKSGTRKIGIDGAGKPQHGLSHHMGRGKKKKGY